MRFKHMESWNPAVEGRDFQIFRSCCHLGHVHWRQQVLSRRNFVGAIAGATGLLATSGLWIPAVAQAPDASPKPISGGIQPLGPGTEVFHFNLPAPGVELSMITDFDGTLGVAALTGTGAGTNTTTGATSKLNFDTDMRFMRGNYIGMDGVQHIGAFAFV